MPPNHLFTAEDDMGVLVVLGVIVAIVVAAFGLGYWMRGGCS